jgi:PIN domain nuclease of toxin-antitoxin system
VIYIVDTHALVWHLEANPRLSLPAAAVLSSATSEIVVPSIVLAEI